MMTRVVTLHLAITILMIHPQTIAIALKTRVTTTMVLGMEIRVLGMPRRAAIQTVPIIHRMLEEHLELVAAMVTSLLARATEVVKTTVSATQIPQHPRREELTRLLQAKATLVILVPQAVLSSTKVTDVCSTAQAGCSTAFYLGLHTVQP